MLANEQGVTDACEDAALPGGLGDVSEFGWSENGQVSVVWTTWARRSIGCRNVLDKRQKRGAMEKEVRNYEPKCHGG